MTRLKLFGRKESMSSAPQVPGPTGLDMLKVMREGQRDIVSTMMSLSNQYGDIVRFHYGLWPACLVTHPDHVRHVLQTNNRNYDKGNPLWDMTRWFFREGLLTSEGEFWRRQRRLAQPAFHRKRIAAFSELMVEETVKMLAALMFTSPYVTHRHATFWPNPEGFEPERFEKEREIKRFAYFPFGGGPRQCVGNQMAMMEGSLILATLCQQYRLDLVAGHPIALEPLITLAPRHGIMMTRHRR
ncbi:cytochrome P450 [Endozoicomonas sp. 8E]|uniref:cytochrome P450 n=1 Tax=Endozoicomonas sp. 8E TaxID=3035692 RepID=UPI002939019D|nr:cytochrome P450 [Endozoicomonas sp. 8E]WOG28997.1 cytochrome P450 [Endozoicomonas sp. 8E]